MDLQKLKALAAEAIKILRNEVLWKYNKDIQHLHKRVRLGHLPLNALVDDYNRLIQQIVSEEGAQVYHYSFSKDDYFVILNKIQNRYWLVIINTQGIMETAFPPDDPEKYIAENNFMYLDKLEDILK